MIEIKVRKGVHIFNPPEELLDKVKKDLVFKNPKYESAKRYGKFIGPNLESHLAFFSYNEDRDVLYIPRGYIYYLLKYLRSMKLEYSIKDSTTLFEPINFYFQGKPRPYQQAAIEKIDKYPIGVLESSTGSGKTFMGTNMIAVRKQPTIVLVHTKELLYQWQKQVEKLLCITPGLVGDGHNDIREVTIGIIQSVQNRIEDLKDSFGHVIVDECHRCPSSMWTDALVNFSAKYYLGLSATAYRNDGLGDAIYAFIGPKIHTVNSDDLHSVGAVLKPVIIEIPTKFYHYYTGNYSEMISALVKDAGRNELIAKTVAWDVKKYDSAVLVVSDRVKHCSDMQLKLKALRVDSRVLTSATPKDERAEIIDGVNEGRIKVLFSTIQLIGEGFDAPNLHALFIATPVKYKGRLIQIIGRVLRPEEGKIARVYDFRDVKTEVLKRMGKSRDTIYKQQWGR